MRFESVDLFGEDHRTEAGAETRAGAARDDQPRRERGELQNHRQRKSLRQVNRRARPSHGRQRPAQVQPDDNANGRAGRQRQRQRLDQHIVERNGQPARSGQSGRQRRQRATQRK